MQLPRGGGVKVLQTGPVSMVKTELELESVRCPASFSHCALPTGISPLSTHTIRTRYPHTLSVVFLSKSSLSKDQDCACVVDYIIISSSEWELESWLSS